MTKLGLTGPLEVEILSDGRHAKLLKPYSVELKNRHIIIVLEGFITDFASVPRFFWRAIPPWGKYSPACVVHDFLYTYGTYGDRKHADLVLYELMEALGVAWWRRKMIYRGVRLGGGFVWAKYRRKDYLWRGKK